MTKQFQSSVVIDRPVSRVFQFYALDHARNHPRWDPDIELWLDSNEPLKVGTVIRRRNSRSGKPVDGTMKVVALEQDRFIEMLIHDGPAVMSGKTEFEALNDHQTRILTTIDIPAMDASADGSFLESRLRRSAETMKKLMETEI